MYAYMCWDVLQLKYNITCAYFFKKWNIILSTVLDAYSMTKAAISTTAVNTSNITNVKWLNWVGHWTLNLTKAFHILFAKVTFILFFESQE